jgi:UDP-N-acetylmuramate--alanine ligase
MQDFLAVLEEFDEVVLLDIYPAREEPIPGISSSRILEDLNHPNKKLIKKEEIKIVMKSSDADLFAFLGAGDIGLEVQSITHNFIFQ